jgi:hypothetical protein
MLKDEKLEKYRKFKHGLEKIKVIRMMYKIKKSKIEFQKAWQQKRHLLKVLENDQDFANRLYLVMPETKYYIN